MIWVFFCLLSVLVAFAASLCKVVCLSILKKCSRFKLSIDSRKLPFEISLVHKTLSTLEALVGLLPGLRGDVSWVVTKVLVPLQMLLLSEALVALVTLKRFLVCVHQHVGLEVASGDGGVGA